MEYRGFYDYVVEVYKGDELLGTFQYVTNIWFLRFWLNIHFLYWKWTSIKVYQRLTNNFIGEYKRGQDIPAKPQL
jgi:hypothetical protein